MIMTEDPIIRCNSCGTEYVIDRNSLDDNAYSGGEYGMGLRTEHYFTGEIICDDCGSELWFRFIGEEYPSGAYDGQYSESRGCKIVREPRLEMEYFPDEILSVYDQIFNNPQSIYQLSPREFEELVADVYRQQGFDVTVTQRTRDGGRDVVAELSLGGVYFSTYFECKRFSPNHTVGVDLVRNLYGVLERDRINKGVLVTSSHFSRDARKEAAMYNGRIQLVDYDDLIRLIQSRGMR